MDQADEETLQERLHALLCGELPAEQVEDLLGKVLPEAEATALLARMLELQRRSRAAFGLGAPGRTGRDLMVGEPGRPGWAGVGPAPRPGARAPGRWPGWRRRAALAVAAAAMALIAVSVYLAALSRSDSRLLREELASLRRSVELPDISPAQRQAYQQIWHALGDQAGRPRPWVLLSQDTGEFGYMPAAAARAGGRTGPVLLRCVLATSLGRRVGVVSLILPAGPDLKLSVPGAAELLGLPVACEVSSQDDRSAAVALTVGGGAGMEAGVRGRVTLDGAWVEIGQFQLNGQRLRVAVQALPLDRTVG